MGNRRRQQKLTTKIYTMDKEKLEVKKEDIMRSKHTTSKEAFHPIVYLEENTEEYSIEVSLISSVEFSAL